MNLLKVRDHDGFYRDPNSKAILIDDKKERKSYQNQRNVVENIINNINTLEDEMSNIKNDVADMKNEFKDIKNLLSIIIRNQEGKDDNHSSQTNRFDSSS